VLRPIFENLAKLNLSRDQLLAEAEQGITALVERANLAVAPTNDGADIDAAIAAARDKLRVVDTRAAREALSRRSGLDNPDCHLEISSDEELYAGADMASLFEPCGLTPDDRSCRAPNSAILQAATRLRRLR
jgi:hypothetical protein